MIKIAPPPPPPPPVKQFLAPVDGDVIAAPAATIQLRVRVFGGGEGVPIPVSGCFAMSGGPDGESDRVSRFSLTVPPVAQGAAGPHTHASVYDGIVNDLGEGWHSGVLGSEVPNAHVMILDH